MRAACVGVAALATAARAAAVSPALAIVVAAPGRRWLSSRRGGGSVAPPAPPSTGGVDAISGEDEDLTAPLRPPTPRPASPTRPRAPWRAGGIASDRRSVGAAQAAEDAVPPAAIEAIEVDIADLERGTPSPPLAGAPSTTGSGAASAARPAERRPPRGGAAAPASHERFVADLKLRAKPFAVKANKRRLSDTMAVYDDGAAEADVASGVGLDERKVELPPLGVSVDYCVFCYHGTHFLTHENSALLAKFVSDRGAILPRRLTKCCPKHQRKLAQTVRRSRWLNIVPWHSKPHPKLRFTAMSVAPLVAPSGSRAATPSAAQDAAVGADRDSGIVANNKRAIDAALSQLSGGGTPPTA